MTATKCPRCGGADGAHYTECVVGRLFERLLGDGYPWKAPITPVASTEKLEVKLSQAWEERDALQQTVETLRDQRDRLEKELHEALEAATNPQLAIPEPAAPKPAAVIEREQSGEPPAPEPAPVPAEIARLKEVAVQRKGRTKGGNQPPVKPVVVQTAEATARYVEAHLVADTGTRKDEKGSEWPAYVTSPELVAGYEKWAKANNEPVNPGAVRALGQAAGKKSLIKKQGPRHGDSKPTVYLYCKLLDTDPPLEEQMAKRRAAEKAAGETLGEDRETPKTRYRYTGPRPGNEIPKDYRDLLEPLWEIPGWAYAPRNNNGGGKPRLTSPDGTGYSLANTPSDRRAILNVKAQLRRLGAPF